jgi:hypothetical protein
VKENDFPIVLVLLQGQPAPGLPFFGNCIGIYIRA